MRIAVVSDIHSNVAALEAVLRHAEGRHALGGLWSLGDVVGYGPQPNEVIALLAGQPSLCVSGNHDLAASGQIDSNEFNGDAATACAWTATELTSDSGAYLQSLPQIVTNPDGNCVLCHGSLRDPIWEYMLSEEAALAQFELMEVPWSFVGHTHIPLVIEMDAAGDLQARRPESGDAIPLKGRRLILNPGGVGQPRDGDPRASYAILDTEAQAIEYWRVPYEIERTQRRMAEAGLPVRLIDRLAVGR